MDMGRLLEGRRVLVVGGGGAGNGRGITRGVASAGARVAVPTPTPASATKISACGAMVLMSMSSVPGRAWASTPSAPVTTCCTSGESGSMSTTTSAPATAGPMPTAAVPPAATRSPAEAGRRL